MPTNDIFSIRQQEGEWHACVLWGVDKARPAPCLCRPASSPEAAQRLLACLRRELTAHPGWTIGIVEAWYQRLLCRE
jgi:hypothetical protein